MQLSTFSSTFGTSCVAGAAQPGNLVGEPPVSTSASAFKLTFGREADGVFQWSRCMENAHGAQYFHMYKPFVETNIVDSEIAS
jgi:hypothetical protein